MPLTTANRRGLRMLRATLAFLAFFGVVALGWMAFAAWRYPDAVTRRPRWLDATIAFDHSFWLPLALTFGAGLLLVVQVIRIAWRRIRAGEDLYGQRHGRGLRRHGERALPHGE